MSAARRVGMRQLIDQRQLWASCQQGVEIHLLQRASLVLDALSWNHLQTVEQCLGFLPTVGLDDAHDDVDTFLQSEPLLPSAFRTSCPRPVPHRRRSSSARAIPAAPPAAGRRGRDGLRAKPRSSNGVTIRRRPIEPIADSAMTQNMHRLLRIGLDLASQIPNYTSAARQRCHDRPEPQIACIRSRCVSTLPSASSSSFSNWNWRRDNATSDRRDRYGEHQVDLQCWRLEARCLATTPHVAAEDLTDVRSQLLQAKRLGNAIVHPGIQCVRLIAWVSSLGTKPINGAGDCALIAWICDTGVRWSEVQQHDVWLPFIDPREHALGPGPLRRRSPRV